MRLCEVKAGVVYAHDEGRYFDPTAVMPLDDGGNGLWITPGMHGQPSERTWRRLPKRDFLGNAPRPRGATYRRAGVGLVALTGVPEALAKVDAAEVLGKLLATAQDSAGYEVYDARKVQLPEGIGFKLIYSLPKLKGEYDGYTAELRRRRREAERVAEEVEAAAEERRRRAKRLEQRFQRLRVPSSATLHDTGITIPVRYAEQVAEVLEWAAAHGRPVRVQDGV